MARPPRSAGFFSDWSPMMAYVLGLWWADGCMRIKRNTSAHEIEIASADVEHLLRVAQAVGTTFWMRRVKQGSETHTVTFCSKQMYQDIETLGGTPRKSRTIGFPAVPAACLPHFVRGVVDGDGTLSWNGDRPILQVYSGSKVFLQGLVSAVEQATGMYAPNINTNRQNWYVKWSTVRARQLAGWIYFDNPGLALPRKVEVAKQFWHWPENRSLIGRNHKA